MAIKSGQEARKTRTKPRETGHPYQEFMNTSLWETIDKAIDDLVKNRDIQETTDRSYIVGYICKKLSKFRMNY